MRDEGDKETWITIGIFFFGGMLTMFLVSLGM